MRSLAAPHQDQFSGVQTPGMPSAMFTRVQATPGPETSCRGSTLTPPPSRAGRLARDCASASSLEAPHPPTAGGRGQPGPIMARRGAADERSAGRFQVHLRRLARERAAGAFRGARSGEPAGPGAAHRDRGRRTAVADRGDAPPQDAPRADRAGRGGPGALPGGRLRPRAAHPRPGPRRRLRRGGLPDPVPAVVVFHARPRTADGAGARLQRLGRRGLRGVAGALRPRRDRAHAGHRRGLRGGAALDRARHAHALPALPGPRPVRTTTRPTTPSGGWPRRPACR